MKGFFASAVKWILPCVLFIFRDEVLSLLALSVMGVMCLIGLVMERERCRG